MYDSGKKKANSIKVNSVFTIVPELPHNLNVFIIINTIPLDTDWKKKHFKADLGETVIWETF